MRWLRKHSIHLHLCCPPLSNLRTHGGRPGRYLVSTYLPKTVAEDLEPLQLASSHGFFPKEKNLAISFLTVKTGLEGTEVTPATTTSTLATLFREAHNLIEVALKLESFIKTDFDFSQNQAGDLCWFQMQEVGGTQGGPQRPFSVLDRLLLTHPVWLQLSLNKNSALYILLREPVGVRIRKRTQAPPLLGEGLGHHAKYSSIFNIRIRALFVLKKATEGQYPEHCNPRDTSNLHLPSVTDTSVNPTGCR